MSTVLQREEVKIEPVAGPETGWHPYRWSREGYLSAVQCGAIGPDSRVELIEGEIIQLSPQSDPHAGVICCLDELLREVFGQGHVIRTQMPLAVGADSLPEPDLAVVPGNWRDYLNATPSKAVLVVEVSETSLTKDRTSKAGLYASAGVPEYWVINLQDNLVEVHRQPAQMAGQPFGHHYKSIERLSAGQTVKPLDSAGDPIAVSDILP